MSGRANKILKASFLLLIVSWYSRLLSAISVVVLARNLTKEDFGILAACFVVQGFFNVLSNVGSGQYLLRKKSITEQDIDAAWTINFCSRSVMALMIFCLSWPVAWYMHTPPMAMVLKVMALSAILIGLQNPAMNVKIKNLDYSKLSVLEVIAKSISSTLSVVIAIVYQSYWAVVIADVLYHGMYSIGSQFIVRHRFRLVIHDINVQWQFSKWVLLKGVVSYIKVAFDKIIVARLYSVSELGLYNFAYESSMTAQQLVITPIHRVLYPSLSEYVNNNELLLDKIYKSMMVLCGLYIPIVFGGVYLANLIVPTVFGHQWTEAIPLFQIFLVMTLSGMLIRVFTDVFTLTGEVKKQFFYEIVTAVIFLVIILSVSSLNLYYFAIFRMIIAYIMLVALVLTLGRIIHISMIKIIELIMPFIAASVVMVVSLHGCVKWIHSGLPWIDLISMIIIGSIIYVTLVSVFILVLKKISHEYDFLYKTFLIPSVNLIKRRTEL